MRFYVYGYILIYCNNPSFVSRFCRTRETNYTKIIRKMPYSEYRIPWLFQQKTSTLLSCFCRDTTHDSLLFLKTRKHQRQQYRCTHDMYENTLSSWKRAKRQTLNANCCSVQNIKRNFKEHGTVSSESCCSVNIANLFQYYASTVNFVISFQYYAICMLKIRSMNVLGE